MKVYDVWRNVLMKIKAFKPYRNNRRKNITIRLGDNAQADDVRMLHSFKTSVDSAVQKQLSDGVPVARYDVKKRQVYVEYPDGTTKYR